MSNLKEHGNFLVMEILSRNNKTEIILQPEELVATIDDYITSLIEDEYYEHCSVLKQVKDTFNIQHNNDN
jgi:hypothetical protein